MDEYEEKLHSFRKQQKKTEFINKCKTYLWIRPTCSLRSLVSFENQNCTETELSDNAINSSSPLIETDDSSVDECINNNEHFSPKSSIMTENFTDENIVDESFNWVKFTASVLLWICLFSYSVYIEFGAVFFLLSCFYVIWTNTRTSPKKRNEISAYSVFNPNCERIEGTLDAKQLESEMIYGLVF